MTDSNRREPPRKADSKADLRVTSQDVVVAVVPKHDLPTIPVERHSVGGVDVCLENAWAGASYSMRVEAGVAPRVAVAEPLDALEDRAGLGRGLLGQSFLERLREDEIRQPPRV